MLRISWPFTSAVIALLVVGVMFVYSACCFKEQAPARLLYQKQIMWAVIGLVAYAGFALTDYAKLVKFAWTFYVLSLILLVVVLFIGTSAYGAKRWLDLQIFTIQPSEIAKLATILLLAKQLSHPGLRLNQLGPILGVLAIMAVPMLLIVKEPDLGTAMVFLPTAFAMMFVSGASLRLLGGLIGVGLLAAGLLMGALFLPEKLGMTESGQEKVLSVIGLREYHKKRIVSFIKPGSDPLGAGWNKMQSEIAVGSGGLTGKGFKKGTQNILGFLPKSVAPTDFIYSVIAEEKGFLGSFFVLAMFGVIVGSGLKTALSTRSRLGRILTTGIISMIFFHVFINIAMTVGLMPITGLPLPLLSYGGSFMVVTLSALGIVQSVHVRSGRVDFA